MTWKVVGKVILVRNSPYIVIWRSQECGLERLEAGGGGGYQNEERASAERGSGSHGLSWKLATAKRPHCWRCLLLCFCIYLLCLKGRWLVGQGWRPDCWTHYIYSAYPAIRGKKTSCCWLCPAPHQEMLYLKRLPGHFLHRHWMQAFSSG